MSALPERLKAALVRLGDVCEIESTASTGLFRAMSPDEAASYLSDSELAAVSRPIWLVHLAHDDPAEATNELEWNGLTLGILKTVDLRLGNETVSRLAIAA